MFRFFSTKNLKLVLICAIILSSIIAIYLYPHKDIAALPYVQKRLSGEKRILIIAPHPDDEALGTGGIIADAVKHNDAVKVVIVTNGDSFTKAAKTLTKHPFVKSQDYFKLGELRHEESRNAMKTLGLPSDDLIFLGYADGSLQFLWDSFWDPDRPRLSGGIMAAYSPYKDIYKLNVPYTGQSVVNELADIIENYKPTDIYYPSTMDEHPDHWAIGAFVEYALRIMNYVVHQHAYIIHHSLWPSLWVEDKDAPETPPADMKNGIEWEEYPLTKDIINAKVDAIKQYKSQMDIMAPFMYAFIRNSEIFIEPQVKTIAQTSTASSYDMLRQLASNSFILIKDQPGINLRTTVLPSSDLLQLNGFISDQTLWLGLKVREGISSKLSYEIHLRLFYPMSVKRMDLLHDKSGWHWEHKANNSIIYDSIKGGIYRKQWLYAAIPLPVSPNYLYINADDHKGKNTIDHIPLYMFKRK